MQQVESAWPFIDSLENDRILERLLEGEGNHIEYEMDPPSRSVPGGTILHLSCNTLSIPHIAYLAQKVMEELDLNFVSMGGPENCCGAFQWATGNEKIAHQVGSLTLGAFRRVKPIRVVSTCPDCDMLFELYMTRQHTYQQANILEVFMENIDRLQELFVHPVQKRVVLHDHDETAARLEDSAAMTQVLSRIPGLEVLPAQSARGLGNHCLVKTGRYDSTMSEPLTQGMFTEAVELGADVVVMPYHGCYRQHLKRQLEFDVEVSHYLSLVAESMGIPYQEKFKEIRMLDDVETAMSTLKPTAVAFGYSEADTRRALTGKVYV